MNVGIIGDGVVGSAIGHGFKKLGHIVTVHDIKYDSKISDIINTDVVFICVPTPSKDNGECDTSTVESVVKQLYDINYAGISCIKSTVLPGTTEKLIDKYPQANICFVPEFLRERCAISDFTDNHDLCVIGTKDDHNFSIIKKLHGSYPRKVIKLSPTEAELVKYFNNVFNATLITFSNNFYEICKNLDVNYSNVKNAVIHRDHIYDQYLDCNDNFRGFGGACLPKDTSGLAHLAKSMGLKGELFKTVLSDNENYITTTFEGMRDN